MPDRAAYTGRPPDWLLVHLNQSADYRTEKTRSLRCGSFSTKYAPAWFIRLLCLLMPDLFVLVSSAAWSVGRFYLCLRTVIMTPTG